MDTFSETCAVTPRKYVSELGMRISNLLKTLQVFLVALIRILLLKSSLKMLNFQSFLPLKELLLATFSEACALNSR